jgi:hypothetical protein
LLAEISKFSFNSSDTESDAESDAESCKSSSEENSWESDSVGGGWPVGGNNGGGGGGGGCGGTGGTTCVARVDSERTWRRWAATAEMRDSGLEDEEGEGS